MEVSKEEIVKIVLETFTRELKVTDDQMEQLVLSSEYDGAIIMAKSLGLITDEQIEEFNKKFDEIFEELEEKL